MKIWKLELYSFTNSVTGIIFRQPLMCLITTAYWSAITLILHVKTSTEGHLLNSRHKVYSKKFKVIVAAKLCWYNVMASLTVTRISAHRLQGN
jgi:hypothetical protein